MTAPSVAPSAGELLGGGRAGAIAADDSGVTVVSTTRLASADRSIAAGWVAICGGSIVGVGHPPPPNVGVAVEVGDLLVAAGFVDLHVHGANGEQFNGDEPASVAAATAAVAAFHAAHGTTSLVATTVTDDLEVLEASLSGIAEVVAIRATSAASVLGSHLEGPWLAPTRRGAHDPRLLALPDPAAVDRLLVAANGTLRLVTLAPELPGATAATRRLAAAGVVVAVGHTDADLAAARAGFAAGASHLTHCFNAMAPLGHRRPGPVGAALADPAVSVEVIADGVHVDPVVIGLLARLAGDRLVAVTDATAACGLPDGRYRLGPKEVVVSAGTVRLDSDGATLAGSTLTMERAVAGLVAAGVPLADALHAAAGAPANAIGATSKGRLVPGADADLVVLDANLRVRATIVGGRAVHDPGGLFAGTVVADASRGRRGPETSGQ